VQGKGDEQLREAVDRFADGVRRAMDDDFNTAGALAQFQHLRSEVNRLLEIGISAESRWAARETFRLYGDILGLFQLEWRDWEFKDLYSGAGINATTESDDQQTTSLSPTLSDAEIELKIDERNEARKKKEFRKADAIRSELASFGIIIEDRPDGTSRWKR
jgi:cysteinyl-tRNA synthetase